MRCESLFAAGGVTNTWSPLGEPLVEQAEFHVVWYKAPGRVVTPLFEVRALPATQPS